MPNSITLDPFTTIPNCHEFVHLGEYTYLREYRYGEEVRCLRLDQDEYTRARDLLEMGTISVEQIERQLDLDSIENLDELIEETSDLVNDLYDNWIDHEEAVIRAESGSWQSK